MRFKFYLLILFGVAMLSSYDGVAQKKIIKGTVRDQQSDEPIPFASVLLKNTDLGSLTDSSGKFSFAFTSTRGDTLLITSVGVLHIIYGIIMWRKYEAPNPKGESLKRRI